MLVAHPVVRSDSSALEFYASILFQARSTELAVIIYKKELLADGKKGCSHLVPIERALPANDVQLEPRQAKFSLSQLN